ncbi:Mu transposase C-terminal domain-containing protein [Limnobaculum xujianqingii]|uniref:Mu transposase C-terminal domain-containing protein n=1 Tax=Limnobaculum xujianqingii TaxID=2738837 RepID=UPI0011269120|nr:Mu transposase C-terminal domain-containing protein [Limnobaculum xujianqingii]
MWITVADLVGCKGLPSTERGCRKLLDKVALNMPDIRRKKAGSKAFEYDVSYLPSNIQSLIEPHLLKHVITSRAPQRNVAKLDTKKTSNSSTLDLMRQCPSLLENKINELTDNQRQIADARMSLAIEVLRIEEQASTSRIRAIRFIIEQAKAATLPERLMLAVNRANARKGSTRVIGERSLNQWVVDYLRGKDAAERLALLAPGHHKAKKAVEISWLPMFLAIYRQPNGISIAEAYRQFCDEWAAVYEGQPAMLNVLPSLDAVHRALAKLPKITRMKGRVTGAALRAIQTYVKRDWSQLTVNDVWIGDGHGLKMKVAHPEHGQPFIPEVTLIMDGVSRFVVGWSISLSENTIAVADALRHGMSRNGLPLFYYSDNGGGEKNHLFDADITGILPRLGVGHETGIPGNPQGRGIIERAHQTILFRIARQFATFHGSSADRDSVRITSRQIVSAVNARNQDKELSTTQRNALAKLPSWNQLIDAIENGVEWYNSHHEHSELPKRNGRHMTPASYRAELLEKNELHYLSELELRDMFMPQVVRVAQRGWLSVFNNEYFAEELINVDGERVSVAFDIHSADRVIVRKLDGTFVCEAVFNGNKRAAFPVAFVEKARAERTKRRLNLVEKKAEEIKAELRPVIGIEDKDFSSLLSGEFQHISENPEPIFMFESEREEYRAKQLKTAR